MPHAGPLVPDEHAGRRVKDLRLAAGRSQADLTGPGMSAGYLSMIENGTRTPSTAALRLLAGELGTTPEYLATGAATDDIEPERRIAFAEIALRNGSAGEALAEFDAVLTDCPPRLRPRALLGRANANEALHRLTDAIADFTELRQAAEPGSIAWAERSVDLARTLTDDGDRAAAIEFAEEALAAFEDLGLPWHESAIRLGVTLAGLLRFRDLNRAVRLIERLIRIADQLGSPLARGSAYWNASIFAHMSGRTADSLNLAERAIAMFGETDHAVSLATLRGVYGQFLAYADADRAEEALAILRAAIGELRDLGAPLAALAQAECNYAEAAMHAGHVDEALTLARRLVAGVAGEGTRRELAARLNLAEAIYVAGAEGAAEELAKATAILASGGDSRGDESAAWQRIAALNERLGDATAALDAYRRALSATGRRVPPELPRARSRMEGRA
ncbi:hypothetical protein Afil01_32820 [Actinorhabdospora filicis]|uniref:HTH cro/C1-type domain-containing protein n=1 Tax=Actinorhabdospora filicis TaxID=1785913 RepID=A0A9W6SK32_9ACTN|nr:helix-turn-helix transcriptional regulator [Actinorhabdospora filicis]GLZ78475.1 hypothetical protein Afil01_32820 [Actinorhabdospora filicis]